jgi:Fic/DOC family
LYSKFIFAFLFVTHISCQIRPFENSSEQKPTEENEASETTAIGARAKSPLIGPVFLNTTREKALKKFEGSFKLATEYAQAAKEFEKIYGTGFNPYHLAIVRSTRFISRGTWDKNKDQTSYNPILLTDKYVLEREQQSGQAKYCRRPDFSGKLVNVWESFDRASSYVNTMTLSNLENKGVPWYSGYLKAPVPNKSFSEFKRTASMKSNNFDIDVLLSLHVAGGEGATQNTSSCGRIGQIKTCDAMPYSPFFKPPLAVTPCMGAGNWEPTETQWKAMLSSEMQNLGQTALPLPKTALIASHAPTELKGNTCGSSVGLAKEKSWRNLYDPEQNGWAEIRKALPNQTTEALKKGSNFIANETKNGRVGAFALYAGVVQTYKELLNMKLKSDVLVNHEACAPCGAFGGNFNLLQRTEKGEHFCPISFNKEKSFNADGTPKLDSAGKPISCIQPKYLALLEHPRTDVDFVRNLFEPDTTNSTNQNVVGTLNKHFTELKNADLTQDPIERAAWIQQKTVAMHPFIDGDGRLSRFLMESTLHASGIPFPMLEDFWDDTQMSTNDYAQNVKKGIERQIGAVKACSAFASCVKGSDTGAVAIHKVCQSGATVAQSCSALLTFNYSGKQDTIKPCDCNVMWNDNPKTIKWAGCP